MSVFAKYQRRFRDGVWVWTLIKFWSWGSSRKCHWKYCPLTHPWCRVQSDTPATCWLDPVPDRLDGSFVQVGAGVEYAVHYCLVMLLTVRVWMASSWWRWRDSQHGGRGVDGCQGRCDRICTQIMQPCCCPFIDNHYQLTPVTASIVFNTDFLCCFWAFVLSSWAWCLDTVVWSQEWHINPTQRFSSSAHHGEYSQSVEEENWMWW